MALPAETSTALRFLGYEPMRDYEVHSADGRISLHWLHADPKPSEQKITDTLASAEFLSWRESHGGDAVKTKRQKAAEAIDADDRRDMILRAALLVMIDEVNLLRAQHRLPERTAAQMTTAIKKKITAGLADK